MRDLLQLAISHYGIDHQWEKFIEELSELQYELENDAPDFGAIVSEIADVQNMIDQFVMHHQLEDEVADMRLEKMMRQLRRIQREKRNG